MLAAGGNAIDAAVAALFALTVVEPMMVWYPWRWDRAYPAGRRTSCGDRQPDDGKLRSPRGRAHTRPIPTPRPARWMRSAARTPSASTAVAAPGNLKGWCEAVARFGTFPLADVMEPAIRHASRGFRVTPYLRECVSDSATDMARDPEIAKLYLPDGSPIAAGTRLVTGDYAETLRSIAREGPDLLYAGALGTIYAEHMARSDGYITRDDLTRYRTVDRDALRGTYRGFEIVGPPPPSSGPLHIIQMLNILEGYDIGALGFGSAGRRCIRLAEVLKIAFADRTAATADPAFVKVPVEKLLSKYYAADRRARIDLGHAQSWSAEVAPGEGAHTTSSPWLMEWATSLPARRRSIRCSAHRLHRVGTGMIPNNYMFVFTPHPGRTNSVAPGKRVTSSMSPIMLLRNGLPRYALACPAGCAFSR